MERVVTINLNGNPYQLEEPAYDALRAYLDAATRVLADNPDKTEIVRDLEQAVADKCASYLSASKSVVSADEMKRIIEEMGPVEVEGEDGAKRSTEAPHAGPVKRLYRIKDGAMISGVCSGLGAYFDLDANLIRILFVVAALFTSGFMILVYIAMMFLVPSAHTSAEWAAAHGVPFNAQEVIDRAKREYSRFSDESGRRWRAGMRRRRREWRDGAKHGPFVEMEAGWGDSARGGDHNADATMPAAQPAGYLTRVIAGLFAFIFSIITAALLIAFLVALFSLLGAGSILGWSPPLDAPFWLVVVILCIVYAAVSAPFSALRRASYATVSGHARGGHGYDALVTIAIAALAAWLAWLYLPDARMLMEQAYVVIRDFADYVTHWN
jgi:phage shock protein PspC (stress-responsive transcriptional regulator)